MTDLFRFNGGVPAPLPAVIIDPETSFEFRAPLAANDLTRLGYAKAPPKPADTETQIATWNATTGAWVLVDRPEPPSPPAPALRTLGKLEFIGLAQSVGGMTDEMLVAAYKDAALEAFWVKYQMASQVQRDHEVTTQALGALDALGYLPNGAEAVLAAWPTE